MYREQQQQYGANQRGSYASLGAHEALEVHEVLTMMINGLNQFQLYRPHVKDQELAEMMDRQMAFGFQEYNGLINLINQRGMHEAVPYRAVNATPKYGLHNPATQSPNTSLNQMNDQDVASGMLGFHKTSASMQMKASLECADPQLRHTLAQGSLNCNEMAFETWAYMNRKGFYQVPTMKETTTQTFLKSYSTSSPANDNMQTAAHFINPNLGSSPYQQ